MREINRESILGYGNTAEGEVGDDHDGVGKRPRITSVEPKRVGPGQRVTVEGRNLARCEVYVGPYETTNIERSDDEIVVELEDAGPPVLSSLTLGELPVVVDSIDGLSRPERPPRVDRALTVGDRLSVTVVGPAGAHIAPDELESVGFDDLLPEEDDEEPPSRHFTGPAGPGALIRPDETDQRYLALVCLPADRSMPSETSFGDERRTLESKTGSASRHWREATLGSVSFDIDVFEQLVRLPEDWSEYYRRPSPTRIDATGASYPVDLDGTTLEIESGLFDVTVSFSGDGLELTTSDGDDGPDGVVGQINDAISDAATGGAPVEAKGTDDEQLRLETTDDGKDTELEVPGGSAVGPLGLDSPDKTDGTDGENKIREVVEAAVDQRLAADPGNASSIVESFDGVIVAQAIPDEDLRPSASLGNWNLTFTLPDETEVAREVGLVHITTSDSDTTYAHEIGHNLGLPDLYDEAGPPKLVGTELTRWDIMANSSELHPSAWIKAWKSGHPTGIDVPVGDPWVTDVEEVYRPSSGSSIEPVEVLLFPSSISPPSGSDDPYDEQYPDLPVVQAVRLHTSPSGGRTDRDWAIYLEAREQWTYDVSPYGISRHDDKIPEEGVLVTDAVNRITDDNGNVDIPVHRANATRLADPLSDVGDEWTRSFPGGDELTVRIEETIVGNPTNDTFSDPTAYKLRIEWGPGDDTGGTEADLAIRPWDPPPYDSPDIWLDSDWENGWDEYKHSDVNENPKVAGHPVRNGDRARVGEPSRVYARVWNHGPDTAENVRVQFSVKVPPGNQPGVPIGQDTISKIEPDEFGLASVTWTPADDNDEHVCIQAGIVDSDATDPNRHNDVAQENVTDWYLEQGSPYEPVEQPLSVHNPLQRRAQCIVDVSGLREGYHVDVDKASMWLDPGETRQVRAIIRADDDVPLDVDLRRRGRDPPLVSINYLLSYGCTWVPVNGVSGEVHTVQSSSADATVDESDGSSVDVSVDVGSSGESASGATVTVTVETNEGAVVGTARTIADESGEATVTVDIGDTAPESVSTGRVVVGATPATAPAETTLDLRGGSKEVR